MKQLLVATTNPGKLKEIKKYCADLPVTLVSLKDVGITDAVEETGNTFEENAILKAKYYARKSGLPTIADDGGFEIDALGGEPGVKSHRWVQSNRESTDEELISYTFKKMQHIPEGNRQAQLRLVLAFALPTGEIKTTEASIRGIVPLKPSPVRHPGFPYRSILFLPEINTYYDHEAMTEEQNQKFNHRRRAIEALKPTMLDFLAKRVV